MSEEVGEKKYSTGKQWKIKLKTNLEDLNLLNIVNICLKYSPGMHAVVRENRPNNYLFYTTNLPFIVLLFHNCTTIFCETDHLHLIVSTSFKVTVLCASLIKLILYLKFYLLACLPHCFRKTFLAYYYLYI